MGVSRSRKITGVGLCLRDSQANNRFCDQKTKVDRYFACNFILIEKTEGKTENGRR